MFCGAKTYALPDEVVHGGKILIISAYNPDSYNTTQNITQFLDTYNELGGECEVSVENMNCLSLSEAFLWQDRMKDILTKYINQSPRLIILLGQEAWASFLSQDNKLFYDTPVFCAMSSRNAVLLPDSSQRVDLSQWAPQSIDVFEDLDAHNIRAGYTYEYDIVKNVELILSLYPNTNNIAFISDNTYGGVSLQALFKQEMVKFPTLNYQLLDGRVHTIYSVVHELEALPENTAIILGTWKVDKTNAFFMRNAIYAMVGATRAPVFTVTSTGLGNWAVGGYNPEYRDTGADMAHKAFELLNNNRSQVHIDVIPNKYKFDAKMLETLGIDESKLPQGAIIINREPSFMEKYQFEFWSAIITFVALLVGLVVSLWFFFHTKKLQINLEKSAVELRAAKDDAENSNRLKSAFIANMSHEIRTPLNSIVGFSDILVNTNNPVEREQYIKIIQSNSTMLLQLFSDILDLSKIEANSLEFFYADIEFNDLLTEVEGVMAMQDINPDVPVVVEHNMEQCWIHSDKSRLMQVMINLLSNALKFTRKGCITVRYEPVDDEQFLLISVSDTGIGVAQDKLITIFDRFVKLDNFSQGTGLGLPITQVIVTKFGGHIWAESTPGVGTTFKFTIPYQKNLHLVDKQ